MVRMIEMMVKGRNESGPRRTTLIVTVLGGRGEATASVIRAAMSVNFISFVLMINDDRDE